MSDPTPATDLPVPSGSITISANALLEDMGDEAVILNLNNERYYGLDKIGMNFWHWLNEEGDVDKALARAVKTYDIAPDVLKRDLGVFVVELHNAGLVTFGEADS
ncbi:PqqD family protein [Erythrobacter sp. F6033]|uniref:PqqD family protein n=1 Tax=Erythrobacter sp. F6033 TaxID=2926401 RepID=UPI001FF1E2FC|nr:PqqD family protein [Erythrobacter sp. F6033]MCK0127575.1 PqqD family protein [Erythrobacter sp. F6033]